MKYKFRGVSVKEKLKKKKNQISISMIKIFPKNFIKFLLTAYIQL